jgi:hypothetical protein
MELEEEGKERRMTESTILKYITPVQVLYITLCIESF